MNATEPKIDPAKRYTRDEVAGILNLSYWTVKRLVRKGLLLEEGHLGSRRILGEDLLGYLEVVREAAATYAGAVPGRPPQPTRRLQMDRFRKEKVG